MCTNFPGHGQCLHKDIRQWLSRSKVAHSERNLSPFVKTLATRKRQRSIWSRRNVTRDKSGKTLSMIQLFTCFQEKTALVLVLLRDLDRDVFSQIPSHSWPRCVGQMVIFLYIALPFRKTSDFHGRK